MNFSRLIAGALLLCALPASAQPDVKPANGLPYPLVSPQEAVRLIQADKLITLHLRDVTLADALKELENQTGVSLDTFGGGNDGPLLNKLSLDLETRSYNEALQAILDEANVKGGLQRFAGRGNWMLMFGQIPRSSDAPKSGVGPFQIGVQNITSTTSKQVTFEKPPTRTQNASLYCSLSLDIDPRLSTISSTRLRVDRAEDEQGRSMKDENADRIRDMNPNWNSGQLGIQLRSLEPGAKQLARLEGAAIFVIATKSQQWEVPDVLNAKDVQREFQSNGQTIRVKINSARKTGNRVQLDMVLEAPMVGGFNATRLPLFSPEQFMKSVRLSDALGQQFRSSGYSSTGGGGSLSVQTTFGLTPQRRLTAPVENANAAPLPRPEIPVPTEPLKLVLDVPTNFVQTEVPFSFSDLPLP